MKKVKSPPNRRTLTGRDTLEAKKLEVFEPIADAMDNALETQGVGLVSDDEVKPAVDEVVTPQSETAVITDSNDPEASVATTNLQASEDKSNKHGFWSAFKKQNHASEPTSVVETTPTNPAVPAEREHSVMEHPSYKAENAEAIVCDSMTIKGDVDLDSSLLVSGKIYGNVVCNKRLETKVGSLIEGNVKALTADLFGGEVTGNITCEENLLIDEATVVHGDLSGKKVVISGKVTGNITASESVTLNKTATVSGNLSSASISVESGAALEGQYTVRKAND